MTKKDAENEMKYRLAMMILNDLAAKGKITNDELLKYKKKLIKKYKPLIGCLEVRN